jgi:hypothetical protein
MGAVWLFVGLMTVWVSPASAMPSPFAVERLSAAPNASLGATRLAQAAPVPPPAPQPPAADATTMPDPIGNVATLTGNATVIRNNSPAAALKLKDDIFKNDVLQTAANASLGVTFNDETTFNLTANARIAVDNYLYEEGGGKNAALFSIVKGTVAFVANAVARTGDMKIATPTATLGIRGTTGLVEVPEGAPGQNPGLIDNVAIKLYPDPDGRVGHIEINGRDGARLGLLSQGATGFAIRMGAAGGTRFAAVPLSISPREAARDRGIVRQVHAAQSVGRGIVTQRRNEIRNNRGNPRQNGTPGQNGQPRQGNLPARPGQPGQPGQPAQTRPAVTGRQGQQLRPAPQRRPVVAPKRRPRRDER